MMTYALIAVLVALVALVGWRLYKLPAALAASRAQALTGDPIPRGDPTTTPGTYEYACAVLAADPRAFPPPLDPAVMATFSSNVAVQAAPVCDKCPSGHHGSPCIYCGVIP